MKLRSRFALRSIALGLAAAGLIAAGSPAEADDKVSLRLKWLNQAQFAGYYVAKEKGFYKDERLDVTINPGGPQIVAENPTLIFCAARSDQPAPACADLARVYGSFDKTAPPRFGVLVQAGDATACSGYFAPTGERLGDFDTGRQPHEP